MAGSSIAALNGQVSIEVPASEDALQPVDLGTDDDGDKGKKAGKRDDQDDRSAHGRDADADDHGDRGGDDDDEGYSPERLQSALRNSRRAERRTRTRLDRVEKQLTRLAVENDGLKDLANQGVVTTATQRQADAQRRYNEAHARRTAAFDAGKADDWNAAERDMKQAEADFSTASAAIAAAKQAPKTAPTAESAVLSDWMEENDWFDPEGHDKYSDLARSLSKQIAADGFNPKSQAHFDELDRRMRKKAPEIFETSNRRTGDDDQADDRGNHGGGDGGGQRESRRATAADRGTDRGPRSVVGSARNGANGGQTDWAKNTKVPAELIRSYAAAGRDINDPKVRERMRQHYNEVAQNLHGGSVNVG